MEDADGTRWEEQRLRQWLTERIAAYVGLAAEDIDAGRPFEECGLDAVGALALAHEAESACGLRLEPTVAWDHPTVGSLASLLARETRRVRSAHGEPTW